MQETNQTEFTGEIYEPRVPEQVSQQSIDEQENLFQKREKRTFHNVKIILIYTFGLYVVLISGVVIWHMLVTKSARWLSPEEIAALEKMFVTGIGAALLGKFGNKIADFK
nr:hypothetical protein [uncultured Chryseobacterium sp.]